MLYWDKVDLWKEQEILLKTEIYMAHISNRVYINHIHLILREGLTRI